MGNSALSYKEALDRIAHSVVWRPGLIIDVQASDTVEVVNIIPADTWSSVNILNNGMYFLYVHDGSNVAGCIPSPSHKYIIVVKQCLLLDFSIPIKDEP